MRLLVFGYGYSARALVRRLKPRGWSVAATFRDSPDDLIADGVSPVRTDRPEALADAASRANAVLVTAPPGPQGCPGLAALRPALADARPDWIGYLSTTGVYGDRRGGWVTERSALSAQSIEGGRRVAAEHDWLTSGLNVAIVRLPGIYGPGRSAFERLRRGSARRIVAPGQVFSRIHVDDLAAGLETSMDRPRAGGIYNLCDDEPAPNSDVVAYAAGLMGMAPPPEVPLAEAKLAPAAMRFYAESKRVSNALAKAELGWRPAFPTYREGLRAILATGLN